MMVMAVAQPVSLKGVGMEQQLPPSNAMMVTALTMVTAVVPPAPLPAVETTTLLRLRSVTTETVTLAMVVAPLVNLKDVEITQP